MFLILVDAEWGGFLDFLSRFFRFFMLTRMVARLISNGVTRSNKTETRNKPHYFSIVVYLYNRLVTEIDGEGVRL
jgi:hypothetical protein